ncbi:MAG: outer membrane lipoprotein carrier protein LolA [Thermodesulfobacteriota bacterium]
MRKLRDGQAAIDSMVMTVHQRKTTALLEEDIETSGTVFLKKPNLLRWEVEKPEKAVVVVDGEVMWQYRPKTNKAYKRLLSHDVKARDTMRFLASVMSLSIGDISKRFSTSVYRENEKTVLALRPKSRIVAKYLKSVFIWYREHDGIPVRFIMEGRDGSTTTTEFTNIKVNTGIDDDTFRLALPEGVWVISSEDDDEFE